MKMTWLALMAGTLVLALAVSVYGQGETKTDLKDPEAAPKDEVKGEALKKDDAKEQGEETKAEETKVEEKGEEEKKEEEKKEGFLSGGLRLRYQMWDVRGDEGRFREDQYLTDDSTYGLDWFQFRSTRPDSRGVEFDFEGRAIHDYDYRFHGLVKKKSLGYLDLNLGLFRRYYDGSNEPWNPVLYKLAPSFADLPDDRLFTDRMDANVEVGLTFPRFPNVIVGWHRWEREGTELLLRGERARLTGDPIPRFRGIPATARVDGKADTFYVELFDTLAEKHNFRLRQEWEQYRDEQDIRHPRYRDGVLEEDRRFVDDPGYRRYRAMLMYDSFLDRNTYVTANYMYDYINNDSDRDSVRPNLAKPNHLINTEVGNSRSTNVWSMGFWKADIVKDLHLRGGVRLEDADTVAKSVGFAGGTTPRAAQTELDEFRGALNGRLMYEGIPDTTLSLDVDLERRKLKWTEFEDVQSHEIFNNPPVHVVGPSPAFLDRQVDILHKDQTYTARAVHRFGRQVKGTFKYGFKNLDRDYTEQRDNSALFYPGKGDYRRRGNDVSAALDWQVSPRLSAMGMYQFMNEDIFTELADKETQRWRVHRGSGSVSVNPITNLVLVGTFMVENYRLSTPASPIGGTIQSPAPGEGPYDYRGDSFSVALDGEYAFNDRTSLFFNYRHTQAMGQADYAPNNDYDEVGIGLRLTPASNQKVVVGYGFRSFDDHLGNGFDNYKAHGAYVTYELRF